MIEIYRFNDKIALHFEGCPTVYISPNDANELAIELRNYSADIRKVSFSNSTLPSRHIGESND